MAKVTEKEYSEIEKLAASRGPNLRESCRESRLARVNGWELKAHTDSAGTAQMAVWGILLNVLFQLAKGQPCSSGDGRTDRPGRFGQAFPT